MMRILLAMVLGGFLILPAYAQDPIAERVAKAGLSKEYLLDIGKMIYETDGANTCLKCHGPGGHGGDQAGAADLRHPRTWRAYQALGGDEAMKTNKEKFLKDIDAIIHDLIRNGATSWNIKFAREHKEITLDWTKVTIPDKADKYNNMMKGLTSDPLVKRLKDIEEKLKKDGKTADSQLVRDITAVADFMHVKTFDDGSDQGGVFK
jgi:mono/diheme cytochrome c family protein